MALRRVDTSQRKSTIQRCKRHRSSSFGSKRKSQVSISASSKPPALMIAGAPASGKGTQCKLLVERRGVVHVSAGDLLRAEVAASTENGNLAKGYMDQGELVPSWLVVDMMSARLKQEDCVRNGWLADGFPRSREQARACEERGIRPDVFLLLEVPEEELIDRVAGRREDPVTSAIYHLSHDPPESKEVAARLVQRDDDTKEKARNRLRVHNENLDEVLRVYSDVLVRIDGNRSVEEVAADVHNAIESATSETLSSA